LKGGDGHDRGGGAMGWAVPRPRPYRARLKKAVLFLGRLEKAVPGGSSKSSVSGPGGPRGGKKKKKTTPDAGGPRYQEAACGLATTGRGLPGEAPRKMGGAIGHFPKWVDFEGGYGGGKRDHTRDSTGKARGVAGGPRRFGARGGRISFLGMRRKKNSTYSL